VLKPFLYNLNIVNFLTGGRRIKMFTALMIWAGIMTFSVVLEKILCMKFEKLGVKRWGATEKYFKI
jgi:hypothetical protein